MRKKILIAATVVIAAALVTGGAARAAKTDRAKEAPSGPEGLLSASGDVKLLIGGAEITIGPAQGDKGVLIEARKGSNAATSASSDADNGVLIIFDQKAGTATSVEYRREDPPPQIKGGAYDRLKSLPARYAASALMTVLEKHTSIGVRIDENDGEFVCLLYL